MMPLRRLGGDSRANASFAFAAVFILLAVTGSSAVIANCERVSGELLAAELETDTVRRLPGMISAESQLVIQSAVVQTLGFDARPLDLPGLQEIISERVEEHFRNCYPTTIGALKVNATVVNVSTSFSSSHEERRPEAPVPGGILVSLQVDVEAKSESVSFETIVDVFSEIKTPLPYISNRLEYVDDCAKTGGELGRMVRSILSQLVQLRVTQGFGAPGHRLGFSSSEIIKACDVELAVNLALFLLEYSEFGAADPLSLEAIRLNFGGGEKSLNLTGNRLSGKVDPFKIFLALRGDSIETGLNLRDFSLQVLYSLVDRVVVRYLEYSHLIDLANCAFGTKALIDDGWRSFVLALTGIDPRLDEALHWVSATFSGIGIPDCAWRAIFSGSSDFSFPSNSSIIKIFDRQGKVIPISVGAVPFSVDLPDMSILRSEEWASYVPIFTNGALSAGEIVQRIVNTFCMALSKNIPEEYIAPALSDPDPTIIDMLERIQARLMAINPQSPEIAEVVSTISPYDDELLTLRNFLNHSWDSLFPYEEAMDAGKIVIAERLADTAVVADPSALPDDWKGEVRAVLLMEMNSSRNGWAEHLNRSLSEMSAALKSAVIIMLDNAMEKPSLDGRGPLSSSILDWIADGILFSEMKEGLILQTGRMVKQISNMTREFSSAEIIELRQISNMKLTPEFAASDRNSSNGLTVAPWVTQTPSFVQCFEVPPSSRYTIDNIDSQGRLCVMIIPPTFTGEEGPRSVHYTSTEGSSPFPYETNWIVEVRGNIKIAAGDRLSLGSSCGESVEIGLEIPITAVSGWPISGVGYERSNTLLGDAGSLVSVVKDRLWPFISPLVETFKKAFDALSDSLSELSKYISGFAERVCKVLSEFGNWLVTKCKEIIGKIVQSPIWKFIELRLSLFGNLETQFKYGPVTVIVSCSLPDLLFRKAKDLVRIVVVTDLRAMRVAMGFRIAKLSNGNIDIVANSTIRCRDLTLSLRVDPLMAVRDHLYEIDGYWRGLHLEAWGPEVNDYQEASASLSDIPGLGAVLSDIMIPELGISLSIDAGFNLKYRMPITDRLSINEVELNPPSRDAGREWIEIYNPLDSEVSVEGYILETTHGEIRAIELSGRVPANGYSVFTFPHASLDNGDTRDSFAKGDAIVLKAPSGRAIDSTPLISDTANDGHTWHRRWDGGPKWDFGDPSKGSSNGNPLINSYPDLLTKICFDALMMAFEDEKDNVSASIEFVKNLLASFLRELIYQIADFAANLVNEANLFIDIGINDISGSAGGGFKLRAHIDGDLIRQMIIWFAEQMAKIFGRILWNKDVSLAMTGKMHPAESIYIGIDAYCRIGTPEWLSLVLDTAGLTGELRLTCTFLMNLATLGPFFGKQIGSYRIIFGLHIDGLPGEDLLEPLSIHSDKVDLWLVRGTLTPA